MRSPAITRTNRPGAARIPRRLVLAPLVITGAIGVHILAQDTLDWTVCHGLLLAGGAGVAASVFLHAAATASWRHAGLLFGIVASLSFLVETTGLATGVPFGSRYHYHPALQPCLGEVPVFIVLDWCALSYPPLVLLRRFPARRPGQRLAKSALAALALVSADILLDPGATALAVWTWHDRGAFFGIPLPNFLGWWLTGFACYTLYLTLAAAWPQPPWRAIWRLDRSLMRALLALFAGVVVGVTQQTGSLLPAIVALPAVAPALAVYIRAMRRGSPPPAGFRGWKLFSSGLLTEPGQAT